MGSALLALMRRRASFPASRPRVVDAFNIGLLHTSLAGSAQHDDYAPCSIAELVGTGFDYWCLGHIHQRKEHSREPHIVMPGMPQGRDINEAGSKSATLVTIGDGGDVDCQACPTSIAQFERVEVDLTGIEEWRGLIERVAARLAHARDAVRSEHLVARLTLHGNTTLAWRVRRDRDLVKAEADERAASLGHTWVEKVEVGALERPRATVPVGPVNELAEKMRAVIRSEGFEGVAAGIAEDLERSLPPRAARDARHRRGNAHRDPREADE